MSLLILNFVRMLKLSSKPAAWMMFLLILGMTTTMVGCGKGPAKNGEAKTGPNTKLPDQRKKVVTAPASKVPEKPKEKEDTTPIELVDVAEQLGVNFQYHADIVPGRYLIVESMVSTMAWFDYDLDGTQDLYLLNGNVIASPQDNIQNQLFRNIGGSFERVEDPGASDAGYGFGVAVGDFDVDGFPDLYITNYGANALYRNNGDGTFEPVASEVLASTDWSTGCLWFDANGDRLPDLFVGAYAEVTIESSKVCQYNGQPGYCGPNELPPQPDRVFVNNGDGTFKDATEELGFTVDPVYTLGVTAVDLNGDAQPEIMAARDLTPNGLFARNDDGTWTDQAVPAGVATSGTGRKEAGMGIACADFDGDQKFDFMLTHYYEKKNTLYRNLETDGDLNFADDSYRSRIAALSEFFLGFGISVLDINRDGSPDVFITNGHVLGPNHVPNEMTGQVLLNNGKGRFTDISQRCGPYFQRKVLGRGSATVDFDNDGDHDIGIGHITHPFSLLEDRMPTPDWIGLDIVAGDRCGTAGGHVIVECGELNRKVPLKAGSSYLCVADPRLLVALPTGTDDVNVTIAFPGGEKQKLKALTRNQYWRISPELAEPAVW